VLRRFDITGIAVAEKRSKVASAMQASRQLQHEALQIKLEVRSLMRSMVARVEQLNGWVEDHSFHWLPLSPLQLLDWPSRLGHTHGKFGMPLCRGDFTWLVDPQNAHPPRLASVSRWFTNGRVELDLMDEARC
jgi:hypothetical protein